MNKSVADIQLDGIDDLWVAVYEIDDLMTYIDKNKHNEISSELQKSIETSHNKMMLLGKRLVNFCDKLGYTSKRAQYGLYPAISYAMDIKVKLVQPYRDDYQNAKKDYLKLAACLGNTEGWLCLIELEMLEHPKYISGTLLEQYLEVRKLKREEL